MFWTNKSISTIAPFGPRGPDSARLEEMTVSEPRTTKGRATRGRIVDTAAALVFEHGVAATTLDDVRAAAGVSKGQLYHYFADKEDLIHGVIRRTIQRVLDAQPALAELSSWT